MIKNDSYAFWRGMEYRFYRDQDRTYKLISYNDGDLNNGFAIVLPPPTIKRDYSIYVKTVSRSEIESAYSCTTYGIYKGYQFQIVNEKDGKYFISTGDPNIGEKLGFEHIDYRDGAETWVDKSEVTGIWEDRDQYEDFPMPPDPRMLDKNKY